MQRWSFFWLLVAKLAVAELDCDGVTCEVESIHLLQHAHTREVRKSKAPERPEALASPFAEVLVLSINEEKYKLSKAELKDQGIVAVSRVKGFNASRDSELSEALALLTEYGNANSLHHTVSNWMLCLHTSPGNPPNFGAANSEFWRNFFRSSPRNVSELLDRDQHNCVPKVVAIAAAHLRLWKELAEGKLQTKEVEEKDPWYLVMEEDVDLCPYWRQRMEKELPQAPADAEIIKLYFFGHWRKEDEVKVSVRNDSEPATVTPFLDARDPLRGFDLFKAASYEFLHGASWSSVPVAGFYAGTQAYLIRPSSARKLLKQIRGKPFQDIDMTMMLSANNYVWRRVLAQGRPENVDLLQDGATESHGSAARTATATAPQCNMEPPSDQFW
ncbi:Uncharacterized protein SCF082_LOCUS22945 [Durusdinium trenchii]|uniref:Hexosyltransferase n=1 Tax=Durusdinium trenchii TaxID=1381693 RepID=A0ABP0LJ58_9DINO